ncbi:MAG: hypothetical protein ABJC05_06235 [Pyrinomonadaceae bacterium]
MKRYSCLLIAFALLLYAPRALSQDRNYEENTRKVITVYDPKLDTTVVSFGLMRLITFYVRQETFESEEEGLRLSAFFTYKGKTFVKPESVALLFRSIVKSTNRWELSRHKDLEITADDSHWSFPNVELLGSGPGVLVMESLGVSVPCGIFAKFANAKKVKLRLGDRSLDLSKQHLTVLRDLAVRTGCQPVIK